MDGAPGTLCGQSPRRTEKNMSFVTVSPTVLTTLFCLAVVRQRWPGEVPGIGDAAGELGVCRELPSRLRARLIPEVVQLVEARSKPGPKPADPQQQALERCLRIALALLAVARWVIVAVGIRGLSALCRAKLVQAVEDLHTKHGVALGTIAEQIGLSERTLRRLRAASASGTPLAAKPRAPKRPHGRVPRRLALLVAVFVRLFPCLPLAELYRRFITKYAASCAKFGHPNLAYSTFVRHAGRTPAQSDKGEQTHQPNRGRDAPENIPPGAFALMDTTDLQCFGFGFKLIAFMEAHSREVFAHQLCDHDRAEHVAQVLEEGQESSGGVLALRIDRGTPYLAELTTTTAMDCGVEIRVAQAYTPTDKAILERFFSTAKDALRQTLSCIDLTEGPGDLAHRRLQARALARAFIAGYLRWGYPYIPQPYIDGSSPRARFEQAPPASLELVRAALNERVQHHEHALTLARQLHDNYGFRWSVSRWLKAVRGYTAEDLTQASRRFDRKLLQGCFNCDSRRHPRYLLAIIRNVAKDRRLAQKQRRDTEARATETRAQHEQMIRSVQSDEDQRRADPEGSVDKAVELARVAFDNHGYFLVVAQKWLDDALQAIAKQGQTALDLVVQPVLEAIADHSVLRAWFLDRLNCTQVAQTSFAQDLALV